MASTVSPTTLQAAGEKKAPPDELSKLFKAFLGEGVQENSATHGVPSEVLKQVKEGHGKATEVGKKVCDAAAQGPRPATPSLADALGATPTVPDASAASKKGASTFDTLPSEFSADLSTRPSRDAMIKRPSLGKRASRSLTHLLIIFCFGVAATLAWQSYGDAARGMIATSWPQLAWLAPETESVLQAAPEQTAAASQATASPELQQLKEDLAQLKQELQQLKEIPAALASLRQSVDRLAGSQQQIAGTIAKLGTQKPASPPRPAPAPAPKPLTPPQSEVR
jgi:hypothetical protein